ncbi:hypothetical protein ACLBXB_29665, partial [Methylobacterium mesophilicum]
LNDVLNALDPGLFSACFAAWVEALRETEPDIVAIDGKSSRRAGLSGISCGGGHSGSEGGPRWHDAKHPTSLTRSWTSCWPAPI